MSHLFRFINHFTDTDGTFTLTTLPCTSPLLPRFELLVKIACTSGMTTSGQYLDTHGFTLWGSAWLPPSFGGGFSSSLVSGAAVPSPLWWWCLSLLLLSGAVLFLFLLSGAAYLRARCKIHESRTTQKATKHGEKCKNVQEHRRK